MGDPYDLDTQIGPLVNHAALERVIALIDDAVAKGANVVTGGRVRGDDCLEPTVLTGVTRDMRVYWEESWNESKRQPFRARESDHAGVHTSLTGSDSRTGRSRSVRRTRSAG